MNNMTQPSRQMPYDIYIQEDGCILSVDWCNGYYSTYWINDLGVVTKKEEQLNVPYKPKDGEESEVYWMDCLLPDTARQMLVLTTVFSLETIIIAFELYQGYFACEDVSYADFDMQHANMISDYTDAMQQLHEFTEDEIYFQMKKDADDIFDEHFSPFKNRTWTDEDKLKINAFFERAIVFMKEHSTPGQ